MRAGCVWIGRFRLGVEGGSRADLQDRPVVLGGEPWERKEVLDCSPEAEGAGVRAGMELRQAYQLCPQALFLPARERVYEEAFQGVLAVLDHFSPVVEVVSLGLAFMDLTGAARLSGEIDLARLIARKVEEEAGFRPQIGLGGSRFVAEMAARRASPGEGLVIPERKDNDFLAPLPVGCLPLPPEIRERLELLGLTTLGKLAPLPLGALAEQFGPWGQLAHDLARGFDPRPIIPRPKREALYAEKVFDQPVQDREGLVAALGDLLGRLLPRLQERGSLCGTVELGLCLEGGGEKRFSWQLKEPCCSREKLLRSLRYRLTNLSLEGPVSGLRLWLRDLRREERKQAILLSGRGRQPEPLRQAAARLRERLGHNPIQQVVPVEPSSLLPERRFALRELE